MVTFSLKRDFGMNTSKVVPVDKSFIVAIIVTFNPDLVILSDVIEATWSQVQSVLVVDNGSGNNMSNWVASLGKDNIHAISLQENRGIAAAQNVGIHWALQHGSGFVLLMDQDSIPEETMVNKLLLTFHDLKNNENEKIAAIGPRFKDSKSGHLSKHVCFKRFGTSRIACKPGDRAVPVDFLIASGSLIESKIFDTVGFMDEGLFIDHVDTEWILRARSKGYYAWGHCDAAMTHSLGESRVRLWIGRWRDIPIHKPFRYYYVFRNSILIRRRDYPCSDWRRVDMIRLVQLFIFMVVFHPHRIRTLRMMFLGIVHGLKGIEGPLTR